MIFIATSAAILLATEQAGAPKPAAFPQRKEYAGAKPKAILRALGEGAAAAMIYRMTDETIAYYPLEAYARRGAGGRLRDRLDVERGGLRFSFSPLRPGARSGGFHQVPDYREEARTMAKVMPGFPQPARFVVGVRVSY